MKNLAALILLILSGTLSADSWRAPTDIFSFSYDGEYLVKVVPGESLGDVFGFAGESKGKYAKATLYRHDAETDSYQKERSFILKNPMAPLVVIVSASGTLVTIDNWHNMGYGKIVVAYDKTGSVLVEKSLHDLYSEEQISDIPQSVSSKWWRCGPPDLSHDESSIEIVDYMNSLITISLNTGSVKIDKGNVKCKEE